LRIEDEESIPKKPETILEKPNDKQFEKEIKELKEKIEDFKKKQKEISEKIKKEKFSNNPEVEKLRKKKTEVTDVLEPLNKQLQEKRALVKNPSEDLKSLKALQSSLIAELEITDTETFQDELRSIQKKLGFSNLNLADEKKLIAKKQKMEMQREKVEKLNATKQKIKILNEKYSAEFRLIRELSAKVNRLYEQKDEAFKALKIQFDLKQNVNDPLIKQLNEERENLHLQIDECYDKINKLNSAWDDKWYHFNQQQKFLDYISEANKKIAFLKKQVEKDKKRKEKYEKKMLKKSSENGGLDEQEENQDENKHEQQGEKEHFLYERATCDWLLNYFRDLIGENLNTVKVKENNDKNTFDKKNILLNANSALKLLEKEALPIANVMTNKKKKKLEQYSKKNTQAASPSIITLDIMLIWKVKEIGLVPPVLRDDVKGFIAKVQKVKEEFERQSDLKNGKVQENSKGTTEQPTLVQEEVQISPETKHEEVHTETKNEEPHTETKHEEVYTETKNEEPHTDIKVEEVHTETKHEEVPTETKKEEAHTETKHEEAHPETKVEEIHVVPETKHEEAYTETKHEEVHFVPEIKHEEVHVVPETKVEEIHVIP